GRVDELQDLALERVVLLGRDVDPGARLHDRVLGLAKLLLLTLRPVDLRVADVVADEPVGLREQEDRPLAGPRVLERPLCRPVDRLDVLAVDVRRVHAERDRALLEIGDRQLLRRGGRLGVVVVLADEDGGDLPELGQVEGLVEGADVRRAVAEERDPDARLASQLERERGTGDRGQAAADDRVRAEVPTLDVVEVHRAAVAVRAALELSVELGHQLVRMRAAGERVRMRAVRRGEDVTVLHRLAHADRDRLLADRDVQEAGQLAGAEPLLDLLLEVPDEQHLAQELAQPFLRESGFPAFNSGHEPEFMLQSVRLVEQWQRIEQELPEGWSDARLELTVTDAARADR